MSDNTGRTTGRHYAWHHFGHGGGGEVGDRADCGWMVTREWLNAPMQSPTVENTCPPCRASYFATELPEGDSDDEECWCIGKPDQCRCGGLLYELGQHALNCVEHPFHATHRSAHVLPEGGSDE